MESGGGQKPPDPDRPGFGPGAPGYGPGGRPPEAESPGGPQSPAGPPSPSGPQSPARPGPGPGGPPEPPPYAPPAPPGLPESPRAPGYGGPVPPGGWQQPLSSRSAPPPRAPLASWGSRAAAYFIDGLVLLVPAAVLFVVIVGGAVGLTGDDDVAWGAAIGAGILWLLLFAVIALLYAPLLMKREGAHNGQTWGKQILGIRAVRDDGNPYDFWSAALREVVLKNLAVGIASSIIPFIPWFLNFFWPLWDDQNRAVHDMAASSHVVQA